MATMIEIEDSLARLAGDLHEIAGQLDLDERSIRHVASLYVIVFGSVLLLLALKVIPDVPNWKARVVLGLMGLTLIEMGLLFQRKT